jgi:uncharacterized membrane protein
MDFKFIGKTFGRGLIVVLPIVLTVYLLWWLGSGIESFFRKILAPIPFPIADYFPGMGIILALAIVFLVGLLMRAELFRRLFRLLEAQVEKVPLIKSLYGSFRDMMDFFSGDKAEAMNKVVMVDLDGEGRNRLVGFITRETFSDLPDGIGSDEHVAVYLPMSYQLGGFTTVVPKSAIQPINMDLDEAMKFAITAGVKKNDSDSERPA